MNLFQKIFLFLSLFSFSFISNPTVGQETFHVNPIPVISLDSTKPLLYHASFKVLKYKFTGLIVFKNISEEEGTRIVFLSEAGLSIAEFTFIDNQVECIRTLPVVDRKSAKNYLSKVIYMVLTPGNCERVKTKLIEDETTHICKGNKGKHYYIYTAEVLNRVIYKKGFCKNAIGYTNEGNPSEKVEIKKRNKILVEMKIVANAIK